MPLDESTVAAAMVADSKRRQRQRQEAAQAEAARAERQEARQHRWEATPPDERLRKDTARAMGGPDWLADDPKED